jgi:alcohol dehydrogenase (cytochrome c)
MNNRIKLVACSIAAVATGVLFAQQAPVSDTVMNPLANNPTAAIDGQRIFDGTCQTCHGAAGVGDAGRGGPALNTTGLKHGDGDADLFRTIRQGVSGTQMPPFKGASRRASLATRQLHPHAPKSRRLARGFARLQWSPRAMWRRVKRCSMERPPARHVTRSTHAAASPVLICRMPAGSHRPRSGRRSCRQTIRCRPAPAARGGGGGRGAPPPVTLVAKMPDGREIRGVRRNEDTYSAQIVDASGQLHLLNKLQATVSVENRSLMPGDYATRLSADEITNIVGFLRMQQGRDQNKIVAQPVAGGVSYQRLLNAKAEPHNWMMYWGDYSGQHYSALTQITPANARQLKTAWSFPILGGNSTLEATPIVVDGVMYTTGSGNPATVTAIDARSGRQIWRWTRQQKIVNPYEINPYARGVTISAIGFFLGTLDGALVAVDARTGQTLWEQQVVDTMEGSSITSPPLVLEGHGDYRDDRR